MGAGRTRISRIDDILEKKQYGDMKRRAENWQDWKSSTARDLLCGRTRKKEHHSGLSHIAMCSAVAHGIVETGEKVGTNLLVAPHTTSYVGGKTLWSDSLCIQSKWTRKY